MNKKKNKKEDVDYSIICDFPEIEPMEANPNNSKANRKKYKLPKELICFFDPDLDEVAFLMYETDSEAFYRHEGEWKTYGAKGAWRNLSSKVEWEFDLDGLVVESVQHTFIAIYDQAESDNEAIGRQELAEYTY